LCSAYCGVSLFYRIFVYQHKNITTLLTINLFYRIMIKKRFPAMLGAIALAASAVAQPTSVTWTTLGNTSDAHGEYFVQRLTVKGDLNFKRLGFNMTVRGMKALNPADTVVEICPGYYYIGSSRLNSGADSINIDIRTSGVLRKCSDAPDGVHRVNLDGSTTPVKYQRLPFTQYKQWANAKSDGMPYGPKIYDINEALKTDWTPSMFDIIPSFKKVTLTGGEALLGKPEFVNINPENPDYFRATIKDGSFVLECRKDRTLATAIRLFSKVFDKYKGKKVPNVVIEDWPDYEWRGIHVDISRNFQSVETMKNILGVMVANGFNKLHFHFSDDEAWRLEIPGLPELTSLAGRRGYSEKGETEYLYQTYCGDGNPNTTGNCSNGYWTRHEFVEFLRMAKELGIDVLPEIESPGHARAAIKAMERRHLDGDDTYRLIHDGDTSKYRSAQAYHDCVMNPALPGPYKFMAKVVDEIVKMYAEAGVHLLGIHIGGDEVPEGAWGGSQVAQDFMKANNIDGEVGLHAYFVRKIAQLLKERDLPMFGWEEIAVGHGADFDAAVAPTVGGVNCWHSTPEAAIKALQGGYPVILSNVNRFYLDLAYSWHPDEDGLTWGGVVDELTSLEGYPAELCPISTDGLSAKVLGLQGQMWGETLHTPKMLFQYLLPKALGLAERAWNGNKTYTREQFNKLIGEKELPLYSEELKLDVHMRQPGIKVIDNKVYMNAPYDGGEIRYTVDGSEPTEASPLYTAPFNYTAGSDVRARYYRNNSASVTTHLSRID
jgi:hexosaminidase